MNNSCKVVPPGVSNENSCIPSGGLSNPLDAINSITVISKM